MKRPTLRSFLLALAFIFAACRGAFAAPYCVPSIHGSPPDSSLAAAPFYRRFDQLSHSLQAFSESDPIAVPAANVADSVLDERKHAYDLLQTVLQGQRFLESLDALSEIELPIGVVKSGGTVDYSILIDRIEFSSEGATMDVYASLSLPQTGSRLAFHGKVPLSAQGGVAGNARIFLLGDHSLRMNSNTLLTVKGTEGSYVEFDCSGFTGVSLDAELEFSSDLLLPEEDSGAPQDGRLKIAFSTYTQSLHNILLQLSIPPFQIKGLEGFGFAAAKAWLDWSDLLNPEAMVFPEGYHSPLIAAGLPELWRGIYLEDVRVRLPPGFAKRNDSSRVAIGLHEAILDDRGVTGRVYAENVIADGNMSGWPYSVNKLSLSLVSNRVADLALEGSLTIPVVKGRDGKPAQFAYVARLDAGGQYIFSVEIENELKLDMWAADLQLARGSHVVVTQKENRFYPSAVLNGELAINFLGKGPKAAFNSIRFEAMVISSEAPHFRPGTFGFGREGKHSSISKYPVVFDHITVKDEETRVGLAFDLLINIGGKPEDESFAGKAGLVVWGIQDEQPPKNANEKPSGIGGHSWKFEKVELTDVRINIRKPKIIELAGAVRFFDDDKTYGEGFKGTLKGKIQAIRVEASALFGKTETFRYWYADALVELKTGIPIVPGVLSAYGFGGGYYSKMRQTDQPVENTLGRSPSGITYVPDENVVGIRAIVLIGTPRREAMNGDVALEVSINRHGGINSVTFSGNANFMSLAPSGAAQIKQLASAAVGGHLTEKLGKLSRGQVYGSVRLFFDNVNDVFHGNLEIFVNVAGGMVRGVSDGNKAGWAVLHFEKNNWYILIGTPDQPIGLEVARIFKAKSYFMLGKNLPGSPPPPEQVSEILGHVDLDYMRDMNALQSGMGIAFGLHFLVDTGDLRFLMFYGRFSAGTGLDFMLKDYGEEYHCAGLSGPMGINGWYANGQAYAFVMGKIGVKVNLRFYKGTYDILSIGAAAILQARGPNPFWMKGTVGGYYKILGGLVKGKCRFEVTVGRNCKPVGEEDLLEEVNMIAGITPVHSSKDVNVFNTPQVAFNIPVGEIFEITDMEKKTHYFRAVLDRFEVLSGGRKLPGDLTWNREKDIVVFHPADLLPGNTKLKATATLSFEERINGQWMNVKSRGRTSSETIESDFETGEAPDFIPESNVTLSYPLQDQRNFYPKEYPRGFIQLAEGQPYLFHPGQEWIQKVRMTAASTGRYLESTLAYDPGTRQITFPIPEGFENGTVYRFEIVNIPRRTVTIAENVQTVSRELDINESAGTGTLNTRKQTGDLNQLRMKSIFSARFRTSLYNTFVDKMRHVGVSPGIRLSTGANIFRLTSALAGEEAFDGADPSAFSPDGMLIRTEAVLEGNRWYEHEVYPLVYEGYPLLGWMKVIRRDPADLGLPPARDVFMENTRTSGNSVAKQQVAIPFNDERIVYNVAESVASDFFDLQRHAVNLLADHPSRVTPRIEALVVQPLPYLRKGSYRVRFSYVIPGVNTVTSSYEVKMWNRIPDNN